MKYLFSLIFLCSNLYAANVEFSSILATGDRVYVSVAEKKEGRFFHSTVYSFTYKNSKIEKIETVKTDEREIMGFLILPKGNLFFTQNPNGGGDNIQIYEEEKMLKELDCITLSKITLMDKKFIFHCRNYPDNGEELKKIEMNYESLAMKESREIELPFVMSLAKDVSVEIPENHLAKMDKFNLKDNRTKESLTISLEDFAKKKGPK